ncbi:MAG: phage terminase large subunit [bacterium]
MSEITLDSQYNPQPKQIAFHSNPARYRLMVGGAGSGKSMALLWEAIKWTYAHPGIQILLIRRNFPELQKGLIADLHAQIPRDLFRWNDTKHIATFDLPGSLSPSTIHFGYLEGGYDSSLSQYLSSAFPLIGIDEVGQFSFKQWEFLTSRNRLNPGCSTSPIPCMMAATNPMGPGWGWLKALFIDHKPPPELGPSPWFDPAHYWYIHSTVLDNEALLERDSSYLLRLKALSPSMREKLLYGNLDTVSGQYFTCFDPAIHVLPATAFEWQSWERSWIGLDWGLSHHTAILWFTRARHRGLGKSVTVCYRERVFKELSLEDAALLLRASMAGSGPFPDFASERKSLSSIFASHELFARRTAPQSSQTIAAEFSRALGRHNLPGLVRAAGSSSRSERIRGAILLYEDLANRDFFILDTCPQLADSLPTLIRDETDIEDVQKSNTLADDLFDALKHGILSVSAARPPPDEILIESQAAKIEDPVARWLFLTRKKVQKNPAILGTLWDNRR